MLEMGVIVGIGLLVLLVKLSWKWRMRILSNPVVVDVAVFIMLTVLHWGTFSGVMVATIGALFCSVVLAVCRKLVGFMQNGVYLRGMFDVGDKL